MSVIFPLSCLVAILRCPKRKLCLFLRTTWNALAIGYTSSPYGLQKKKDIHRVLPRRLFPDNSPPIGQPRDMPTTWGVSPRVKFTSVRLASTSPPIHCRCVLRKRLRTGSLYQKEAIGKLCPDVYTRDIRLTYEQALRAVGLWHLL